MIIDWRKRPTILEYWPNDSEFILGIDECGTPDIKYIKRCVRKGVVPDENHTQLTLTGIVHTRETHTELIESMNTIKYKYWKEGVCRYGNSLKRVCFHNKEIRKRNSPFNLVNYDEFFMELIDAIKLSKTRIISCSVNKVEFYNRYRDNETYKTSPIHPYKLSLEFVLERFCHRLNELNKKGFVLLESRGFKEDYRLLQDIKYLLDNGNYHNPKSHFENISGIYFNPKWSSIHDDKKSYVILEYADIISYFIHKQVKEGWASKNQIFNLIENKFYRYPNYYGWGLKVFPKK
ncbi:DUF3800 domain-containing protein [Marinicrinis sediminis]|uniref:DUF3800 domain-containing protein n=1 Tax=Marinicrinis sediminis TaxID=1652465 RepID=A0ABW5R7Q8_9BACL